MSVLICYRTRRKLAAWVDGGLDATSARATVEHLERCDRCRADAEAYRRLKGLIQQATTMPEPDWTGLWPGIVRGIQDAREPRPAAVRRGWRQPRWAIGAVAVALLVSLGLWQWLPGPVRSEAGVIIHTAFTEDPRGTVVAYSPPEQDVAVVWVLGLDD